MVFNSMEVTYMDKRKLEEYNKLVEDVNHYSHMYHVENKYLISDEEYDALYKRLVHFEENNPKYINQNSPTQRVGETATTDFKELEHPVRMYSLDNAFNAEDLDKFLKRFTTNKVQTDFYVDCKMDGLAIDIIYRDGILATAITRGNGIKGEDVTDNVKMIPNIPKRIHSKETILVRGEVVVHKSDFHAINREREDKKLSTFSNTRNYAAGSLRQKNPEITKQRCLRFYGWELIRIKKPIDYQTEQQELLVKLGFNIPQGKLCKTMDEMLEYISKMEKNKKYLPYDIDGIVIKQNVVPTRSILGWNNHSPLWAIAWKFTDNGCTTTVTEIYWSMGRTGRLTPVAKINPVNIGGVNISEVNLFNTNFIETSGVGIGSEVDVIRSGDVIPKIKTVLTTKTYRPITHCPYCNSELVNIGTDLKCINPSCKEKLIKTIEFIVSKECLNIKGLGEQFVRELVNSNSIEKLSDIFSIIDSKSKSLSQDHLNQLVTRVRDINMMELFLILGIQGMGKAIAGKLSSEIYNLQNFIDILQSEEQLRLLPVNESVKSNMSKWFERESNKDFLLELIKLKLPLLS